MLEAKPASRTREPVSGPWLGLIVFGALAAIIVAIALWGVWNIYNYYVPNVAMTRDFSWGIVAVSVVAGTAAFFSPCAFGMLPAYFGFYTAESPTRPEGARTESALKLGVAAALGIVLTAIVLAFIVLQLGAAFALGLRIMTAEPNRIVQLVRILLGVALVVLGIYHLQGRSLFTSERVAGLASRLAPGRAERSPTFAFFLYGVAYVVASTPCTANVVAAPVLYSFTTQGYAGAAGTILLIAGTMGALMILVSLLFAVAKGVLVTRAQLLTADIQRVAGALVVVMGLAIIFFSLDTGTFFDTFWRFTPPGVER